MKDIIGFFGGDSQVGTTMTATAVAEQLSQKNRRVLLVCASGKLGDGFLELSGKHSLDDLKAGIISGRVEQEDLQQTLEEARGLWVLPPVRNPLTAKYFPENTHQILVRALEDRFDYVVIDGGEDVNLGLTVSALNLCRRRFFVVTQQSQGLQRYVQLKKSVLEPLGLSGELIINKYQRDPSLLRVQEILALCGQTSAFRIPYVEYGWQAEMEKRTLCRFHKFQKAAAQIAACFEQEEERRRPWEWKWKKNFAWKNI